jgi:hypothetical protein
VLCSPSAFGRRLFERDKREKKQNESEGISVENQASAKRKREMQREERGAEVRRE